MWDHIRKQLLLRIANDFLVDPVVLDIEEARIYSGCPYLGCKNLSVLELWRVQRCEVDHGDLVRGTIARRGVEDIPIDGPVGCP